MEIGAVLGKTLVDNWAGIALACIVEHFYGWFYFDGLTGSCWKKVICRDKGVRSVEGIVNRFGFGVCILASFTASLVRAIILCLFVQQLFDGKATLCQYHEVSLVLTGITALYFHNETLAQRVCGAQLLQLIFELSAGLISASVIYGQKNIKLF